jgi:hypothetical protein
MRVEKVVELTSGIDALYLSGKAALTPELFERLDEAKILAQEEHRPVAFEFAGSTFAVSPSGFGLYRYCIVHPYGQIGLSPSTNIPQIRIQPRTEAIHGFGAAGVVHWFEDRFIQECGAVRLTVSRLDLYADFQGLQLSVADLERFVYRGKEVAFHKFAEEFSGFEFGRRVSKTVCSRIYNKTMQIMKSGAEFWPDLWGSRYDPSKPVLRIEFEIGRLGLRQFGVNTPGEAIEKAGAVWRYCTDEWLTLREVGPDQTRSRWPIADEWLVVQQASLSSGAHGIKRMYEGSKRGNLRKLAPPLIGCLSSFAALCGVETLEDALRDLPAFSRWYEREIGKTFEGRVVKKSEKWAM